MPDPLQPETLAAAIPKFAVEVGISPQGDFSCLDRVDDPFSCLWLSDPNNLAEAALRTTSPIQERRRLV